MAVFIFLAISFVIGLLVLGFDGAVMIVLIQGMFWLFTYGPGKEKKRHEWVQKAYEAERELHQEITDDHRIEELVRKRLMRSKLKRAGINFGIGSLLVVTGKLFSNSKIDLIILLSALMLISGAILAIVGVCTFASAMHDPLTPDEAAEFARKDTLEKGGKIE